MCYETGNYVTSATHKAGVRGIRNTPLGLNPLDDDFQGVKTTGADQMASGGNWINLQPTTAMCLFGDTYDYLEL